MTHSKKRPVFLTIAMSVAILFTAGCQKQSAQEHVDQAKQYLNSGDKDAAVIELKNAIQQDDALAEPRLLLGKIYLERGGYLQAQHEFKQAKNSGYDTLIIDPLLVRAYLAADDVVNTIEVVDDSDVTLPAIKSELFSMKALALLGLGESEQADVSLERAANLTDQGYYYSLAKAKSLVFKQQVEPAIDMLVSATVADPMNSDGWLLLGHTYSANLQHDKAADAYQKAVDLSPLAVQYQLHLAKALVRDAQYDKAEPLLDKLFTMAPENMLVNELRAILFYSRQDLSEAGSAANIALQKGSRNLQLELIAGVSAIEKNNYPEAVRHLEPIAPLLNRDHFANRLYAVALFETGEIDKAREFLAQMADSSEEHDDFIVNMGREFQRMGRVDVAQSILNESSINNLSQRGQAQLALMKLSQNDASGIPELEAIIEQQPEFTDGTQAIVFYHIAANDLEEAEKVTLQWLEREPESAKGYLMKGAVEQRKGDLENALISTRRSLELEPDDIRAQLLLAEIHFNNNQPNEAYQLLTESAKQNPSESGIARALFMVAADIDKTNDVLELYKQLSEEHGQQHMLAKAYAASGDPTNAIDVLERLPVNDRNDDSYALLSRLYLAIGDLKQGESATEKWVELAPNDRIALEQLFALYGRNQKYQSAVTVGEKLEQLFPNNVAYTTGKARMYVAQKKYTMAMDSINAREDWQGREADKDWALAHIYTEKGDHRRALPLYQRTYESAPNARTALALSRGYHQMGNTSEAKTLLTGLIAQQVPGYESLELMLAQIQLEEDPNSAVPQYLAVLKRDPNNLVALNNIAWTYLESNQIDEACRYAQRAYDIAQNLPQVQDTYGYCLLQQGNVNQGAPLIEKAYQALSNEDEVTLHYAESLLLERRFDESKAILNKVNTQDARLIALKKKIEQQLDQ
ncbi:XrtA/PEP-CTERM system TPR-repeat protein PrsT [Vibrio ulleungensis]|uniref:PEP-CTERM system TPR-repeat protein PrsT n=1 Tax=Vibrio ulleungensis TaxID=2807619 RepID=A0ABS2HHC4_9VIBR|nr:XrtA/PEP-CTERM system TPR-repeat protein PrsT [Vibrio ulleungensis]MBM7035206.1 PEP-CTERM system TPR-repeat protein PrsT [Vibrio ulleungensis]